MKKTIAKKIGTGIFVASLLIGSTLNANAKTIESSKEENKTEVKESKRCAYIGSEIVAYLEDLGYTNISLSYVSGSCNMIANTSNSYNTTIYVSGTAIVGHEDVDNI
jgi:hypothetical protein